MAHKWGLVVDLDRCTGCEACVVACHAENNIPTAGADQAARGRAMHWIRVERNWEGDFPNPRIRFQPVLCQQCDDSALRACVSHIRQLSHGGGAERRRPITAASELAFAPMPVLIPCGPSISSIRSWDVPLNLQLNPDVSVRSVGIMEKCTFCVQRIKSAEIQAEAEKRNLKDGEFTTACAQSCASKALVFGDLHDPNSEVSRLASSNRSTKLLGELGTKPNVTYLERGTWQDATNG